MRGWNKDVDCLCTALEPIHINKRELSWARFIVPLDTV